MISNDHGGTFAKFGSSKRIKNLTNRLKGVGECQALIKCLLNLVSMIEKNFSFI